MSPASGGLALHGAPVGQAAEMPSLLPTVRAGPGVVRLGRVVVGVTALLLLIAAAPVSPRVAERAPATKIPGAPTAGPDTSRWVWPVVPHLVVGRFVAPAGPFAPGHRGVDLTGSPGEVVRSAGAGVVVFAGRLAGRGVVSVDHVGGLRTTYEPVRAVVRPGDAVGLDQVIGTLETAGPGVSHCPPAVCLHWGLRRADAYLDPLRLVGADTGRVRLLPVWSRHRPAWASLDLGRLSRRGRYAGPATRRSAAQFACRACGRGRRRPRAPPARWLAEARQADDRPPR